MPARIACPWAAEPDAVPVEDDLSTGGLARAEDHVQDGAATGTDEAGQSDDLATSYLQRSTSHGTTSELGDRQQHLCQVGLCVRGRQRLELATQDELYEAIVIDLGPPDRGDHRTVAEHRDRVGDLHDLLEPVSHEHDGNTLLCIASQRLEQHGHLRGGQAGRRLVQHQDAGLVTLHVQCPGDGHHGLRRWTEGSQVVIRVRVDAVPIQDLSGLATQAPPRDGMGQPAVEEQVLGHREVLERRGLLVNKAQTGGTSRGGRGVGRVDGLVTDLELPSVGRQDAGEDLDQRRLAGAVAAQQRMDLSANYLEGDPSKRPRGTERLDDVVHHECRAARCVDHCCFSLREVRSYARGEPGHRAFAVQLL